jgi:hypothetical protein
MASNIAGSVLPTPEPRFLETLIRNSDGLYKISEDFRDLSSNYAILSFYEENAYRVLGKNVRMPLSSYTARIHVALTPKQDHNCG